MKEVAKRVLSRFLQAGYSGWNPPEGEDEPDPTEDWEAAVDLFPKRLQQILLHNPKRDEKRHFDDLTISISEELVLGNHSGVALKSTALAGSDADEDGNYHYHRNELEYTLWVGQKQWSGSTTQRLKTDISKFEKELKEKDPDGYEIAGF